MADQHYPQCPVLPLAVGSPSLGTLPCPWVSSQLAVPVPTPSSPAPGSLASSTAWRCQIAFPAASSFCPSLPHSAPVPSATHPHSPALWPGGADARPSLRDRMEGPVVTLGLLATLVVCGKSGHHPIPRGPLLHDPPHPSYMAPSPSLRPPSHPCCHFSLEAPTTRAPALGSGLICAQPSPMAQQERREASFLSPCPRAIPVPVLPRQLGPERGGATNPAPVWEGLQ